ncbi:MAG: ATP synthase F1 subunit delta [Saprospiraceae bacterium]
MSVIRIAGRYAKSLMEMAVEQGKLEQIYADMQALREATKHRELYLTLKSPIIHADKKEAIVKALFSDKIDALTLAYLSLLIQKGREQYLPEIASEAIQQYKKMKGITTVRVVSAAPLSQATLDAIRTRLLDSKTTADTLEIETSVDPTLLGGFVIQYDDKRYDASVSSKLAELRTEFTKNLYIREF